MAYPRSSLAELASVRAGGQRPDGFVVVGDRDGREWADRNRFFAVDIRDCDDELDAFAGLDVVLRVRDPRPHRELVQRLALTARYLTVHDTTTRRSEFIRA
jgi:hypothetical protein